MGRRRSPLLQRRVDEATHDAHAFDHHTGDLGGNWIKRELLTDWCSVFPPRDGTLPSPAVSSKRSSLLRTRGFMFKTRGERESQCLQRRIRIGGFTPGALNIRTLRDSVAAVAFAEA